MICEYCNKEHDGKYGSGRFCNAKCARAFSTKKQRKELNKRIRETFKEKRLNRTYEELINQKHELNEKQYVKYHQRVAYYEEYPKVCVICRYERIVEVHHLGSLSQPELQVALCPNHHRECHIKKCDYNNEQILEMRDALIA